MIEKNRETEPERERGRRDRQPDRKAENVPWPRIYCWKNMPQMVSVVMAETRHGAPRLQTPDPEGSGLGTDGQRRQKQCRLQSLDSGLLGKSWEAMFLFFPLKLIPLKNH